MGTCKYVCACMYRYTYIYIYAYMYVCACMYIYTYVFLSVAIGSFMSSQEMHLCLCQKVLYMFACIASVIHGNEPLRALWLYIVGINEPQRKVHGSDITKMKTLGGCQEWC